MQGNAGYTGATGAAGAGWSPSAAGLTGITGSDPSVLSSTSPNDGNLHLYEVGGWIGITAFTSGSVQMQVTYYDPTNTQRTATFTGWLASADAQSFNAAGYYPLYSMSLLCKANTAITINLVYSGSLNYSAGAWINKVN